MFGIEGSIQDGIGKALVQAPENLFIGIAHAMMFVPNQLKAAAVFGEGIWNGMTPEQQATVEAAIRKAIIAAAEAYVKSGS